MRSVCAAAVAGAVAADTVVIVLTTAGICAVNI